MDYIKGVVHQELDGFTEDEAIRANIITFVSFTLNRYYSEHYRNQNKNYHITNDRSVDPGFIERPTEQEPLVRNTDAFFSQFVEYPGHPNFPFLALFCPSGCANEGKLDQAQSRVLAREGKKHTQIIKSFYGENYNTRSAAFIIINKKIESFLGPLKFGDSGGRVNQIQTYLEVIGKNYNMQVFRKAIEENGYFGEKTVKAIKTFQKNILNRAGTQITGVVDQATWYKILTRYYIAIQSPSRNDASDSPTQQIPTSAEPKAPAPTGELVVSVYKKGDLTPIPGTQVEISDMNGNIIRRLQTDRFGNIETITLPALPTEIRSEEAGGAQPAQGKYIITVKHPHHEQVRVEYVKIHASSKATPEIHLSPTRMEDMSPIKTIKIDDSKPAVGKQFENPYNISQLSIHPLSFYSTYEFAHGYEPNPHPRIGLVIPDTIRLHLVVKKDLITGKWIRTRARTIEVPFVEYVKGVLHKEINGFTEDEAIRANVIAVVSFTLNRYYTDFYRRRDQDYHVTDDTSIDHDFDEHHLANAQEPLVRNIEEFFNKYIEYPGDTFFPFLSQYCSGTGVKCAEKKQMEQTPAREMARRGKSHLEIIKHFYGSNFETTTAAQIVIHNELYSFIPPLKLGDTDKRVLNIQHYLDVIGKKYDQAFLSAAMDENGLFGDKTKEAVTLFQKHYMKLSPGKINGILDLKTWYALLTRYLKVVNNGNQRPMGAASLPLHPAGYYMPHPQYGLVCKTFLTLYGPRSYCYYTYFWEMNHSYYQY
ncbi:hypothetical protein B2K_39375 [Paenibacillus mucilaginosus K02]|uniref:Uncharacterized protein n=1 Tax=Paenibacillus mucilaginosus K02 TaxID=997761 RepID=R9UPE3_9BACL|nr:hypothetical protein B2K_39375 [Paenibacillus mucilaginosus K02]